MDYDCVNDLWEQHAALVVLSKHAFNAYMDSLAPPRTKARNASSKELEAAYTSAKATENEVLEKIMNSL